MKLVSDPAIAKKISKMQQRVKWQDPLILERGIDQTRLVLDDGHADDGEFSFLVVGDSGSGTHKGHDPQRRVAELMLPHHDECRFMLHTGDVIYLVGSREYYQQNFIQPYQEFLVGGEQPKKIPYDKMVFQLPILPVPGNHDYYNLPILFGIASVTTLPIRRLLKSRLDLDVGLYGSGTGEAYARAFLDYLCGIQSPVDLANHLDKYYTANTDSGRCLSYQPGSFTRLPNRYYTFRYGGIDFFALDSNTFNDPPPLPNTQEGNSDRRILEKRRASLEQEKQQITATSALLSPSNPKDAEQLDDLQVKLTQIEEIIVDIEKQLDSNKIVLTDIEQLDWLRQKLIESWHNKEVRGRIIYFHHPPYVTEATKWEQAQTLAVRTRLRGVLDAVAEKLGSLTEGRPLVDLVINGHAHCLEYLQTADTGHADSHIPWIVCGGSGFSLRRQREEGPELQEMMADGEKLVARSQLFIGRSGQGFNKHRPYSCLRIDVKGEGQPKFIVRPLVAEWYQRQWCDREIEPFEI
ncbi:MULTISPECIES: metallophosphoesterase [unclassified Tolypothrix]|uniref:metallophosphoesterase n=1 Tax=unclassified Tolypothrix TaxID=2649714 RepID=UPI0005EAA903|nr:MULTISPECIES: metallophosphoesterase [unclassified Tolypothrix]BAY91512.1 metallophosphoesterase [Microchaete diplosiphon NIES-3275]EKF05420.1 putative metallophosphoesterase [Tolypothrix sp. PCC 7601]MBE9081646.1 metallophosphoesterase [Tolypothrix sp. LEGE 11397]UYD25545.1 metallophosphoesterase [Tolypothrix sp. PCC 7712]UYD32214.1 metallophosphoesterase [Tolypothrix sp. PCC 7601]